MTAPGRFRIWITMTDGWQPRTWQDLPQQATALELAELDCFTEAEAVAYLQGHNTAALGRHDPRWAVAMPVIVNYDGEPRPGEMIYPRRVALSAPK